jgi:hypothetical protein
MREGEYLTSRVPFRFVRGNMRSVFFHAPIFRSPMCDGATGVAVHRHDDGVAFLANRRGFRPVGIQEILTVSADAGRTRHVALWLEPRLGNCQLPGRLR